MSADDDPPHCGPGIRGVAMFVDSFVWFALLFVAIFPIAAITGDITTSGGTTEANLSGTPGPVAFCLWLALAIGYHALLEWRYGRTLGKRLVQIQVAGPDGEPPSLRASVLRNVLRLVDWLPLFYAVGIVVALASDRSQRLGDRVADTVVLRQ